MSNNDQGIINVKDLFVDYCRKNKYQVKQSIKDNHIRLDISNSKEVNNVNKNYPITRFNMICLNVPTK